MGKGLPTRCTNVVAEIRKPHVNEQEEEPLLHLDYVHETTILFISPPPLLVYISLQGLIDNEPGTSIFHGSFLWSFHDTKAEAPTGYRMDPAFPKKKDVDAATAFGVGNMDPSPKVHGHSSMMLIIQVNLS